MNTGGESFVVDILLSETEFYRLEQEWGWLYERSGRHNPFLSFAWTAACWEESRQKDTLVVFTARAKGRLVGVAPMKLRETPESKDLVFMADGRSDYLGFLLLWPDRSVEEILLRAILDLRGRWDRVVLSRLSSSFTGLHSSPVLAVHACRWEVSTRSFQAAFSVDWKTLKECGPSWLRQMERAEKRWISAGGTAERYVGRDAVELIPIVAGIERGSWKWAGGACRFQGDAEAAFLSKALSDCPELELWIAYRRRNPVAYGIAIVLKESVWLYQGAYLSSERRYSVGGILDFLAIKRCWTSLGCRGYDYLCGEELYKLGRTNQIQIILKVSIAIS